MDFVYTVCDKAAAEVCPVWPGQPMTARWGVADPTTVEGDDVARMMAFQTAFRELRRFPKSLIPACLSFRPSSLLQKQLRSSLHACFRA
jgi:arsenate reductase